MSISVTVYTEITVNWKAHFNYLQYLVKQLSPYFLQLTECTWAIHSVGPPVFLTEKVTIHSHWELWVI